MINRDIDKNDDRYTSPRAGGLTLITRRELSVSDYLCDLPYEREAGGEYVEVQFRIHSVRVLPQ